MEITFEHQIELRVRYGETDRMGYCYYGNYAQYFEVGRVEALRKLGMSYKEMEDQGILLPVSEFSVKYHVPAFYDDLLTVVTRITAVKGARLYFTYEIINEQQKLLATAQTTLVFVGKEKMSPVQAPELFLEIIAPFEAKK